MNRIQIGCVTIKDAVAELSVMKERREGELKYPTHVKLRIDLKTMRRCTYSEYQQQNRLGWMLTM